MKRVVSLLLIICICAGVYWVRASQAEARVRLDLSHCKAYPTGTQAAMASCDRLLAREKLTVAQQAELLVRKGRVFQKREDHDAAVAQFDLAIALQPDTRAAYGRRSYSHLMERRMAPGIADARVLTERWPEQRDNSYAVALKNIAWAYRKMDQPLEEIEALNAYLAERPDDASRLRRRAHLLSGHADQFDRQHAIFTRLRDLSHAHAVEPENWKSLEQRASLLVEMKLSSLSMRDAIAAFELLLEHGDKTERLDGAGRELVTQSLKSGRLMYARVQDGLRERIEAPATGHEALMARSNANYMMGRMDAAIADLEDTFRISAGGNDTQKVLRHYRDLRDLLDETGLLSE